MVEDPHVKHVLDKFQGKIVDVRKPAEPAQPELTETAE